MKLQVCLASILMLIMCLPLGSVANAQLEVTSVVDQSTSPPAFSYSVANNSEIALVQFGFVVGGEVIDPLAPSGWRVRTIQTGSGRRVVFVSTDAAYDLLPSGVLSGFAFRSGDIPGQVRFDGMSINGNSTFGTTVGPCLGRSMPPPIVHSCDRLVEIGFAPSGIGPTTVAWRRGTSILTDGLLPSGARVSGTSTFVLNIENATPTEAGEYSFSISNVCGRLSSEDVRLLICPADVDDGTGSGVCDGGVSVDDLLFFLAMYAGGASRADLDNGTGSGTPDGGVTIDDLLYYLQRFEAGC